jgi:MFS family permease
MRKLSTQEIFRPGLLAVTVIVTAAYFLHVTTFYFIVKWVPTIVVSMGFKPSSAGYVLSWLNVGGAIGGTVMGLLSLRYSIKALTLTVMLLSTIAVTMFGRAPADLLQLTLICMAAGFCTNASITGMYALFAKAFPTHVRASGTGFAVGVGRGGSVVAPIIAGFLFKYGYSLPTVAFIMGLGSLLAAAVLMNLRVEESTTS